MAIHFQTTTPKKLLSTFKKAIDDGHVVTWSYDSDGDFSHTPEQWNRTAWLVPKIVEQEELVLNIIKPQGLVISRESYAVYHGRVIESMLAYCDELFELARATAMPEDGDKVG